MSHVTRTARRMANASFSGVVMFGILLFGLISVVIANGLSGQVASHQAVASPCGCEVAASTTAGPGAWSIFATLGTMLLLFVAIRVVTMYRDARRRVSSVKVVTLSERLKRLAGQLEIQSIRQIAGARPEAFCAGLLRPTMYVTTAGIEELSDGELLTVLKHEQYHLLRRDPLRMIIADAVLMPLRMIPGLGRLVKEFRTGLELAADEHAITSANSRTNLSRALLKFVQPVKTEAMLPGFSGTTDRRIDQLLGRPAWAYQFKFLALMLVLGAALFLVGTVQARERADATAQSTSAGQCHQLRVRTCIAPPHQTQLYRTSVEFVTVR